MASFAWRLVIVVIFGAIWSEIVGFDIADFGIVSPPVSVSCLGSARPASLFSLSRSSMLPCLGEYNYWVPFLYMSSLLLPSISIWGLVRHEPMAHVDGREIDGKKFGQVCDSVDVSIKIR